ncbi:HAD-IB family hydrolase [uncultured Aquimarina sp.]|uniref:HAD-IB family hydrolase n=1 Tax=uncultured Aquimarina sp. TaxID=575652 RepID=UPI002617606E|nr:HAD-IB family hydrolase [uncultured Aquimarina sp.]
MIVAFFDFDGTITRKDSFLDFISFTHGKLQLWVGLFMYSYYILGYKLKWVSDQKLKELFISHYYKGTTAQEFKKLGIEYCEHKLSDIIFSKALKRIQWHKNQSHRVVVVTASISQWIKPWCDELGIEIIASELEIQQDKITGKLAGKNCNGPEKVSRIKERYDLDAVTYCYAYGNSNGDKELLAIADEQYYQYF